MGSSLVHCVSILFLLMSITKVNSLDHRVFNVTLYGTVADGKTDNLKAILDAWSHACQSDGGGATIVIPNGSYFVSSLVLKGPCKGKMVFTLRGDLKASIYNESWGDADHWISFQHIDNLRISEGGSFDGQGASAWPYNNCDKNPHCKRLPTSLSVTNAVISALSKSGFDNQTAPKVLIQSSNSSVLMKFKDKKTYELVYKIDEEIRSIDNATLKEIESFADSVVINKASVFPDNFIYLTGSTDVVEKVQSYKLPVYVETFINEFVSQAWDFFSDATVEINSYVTGANINGVITDFPETAARYKRNRCLGLGSNTPSYMSPVQPGSLMQLITAPYMPPAEAPNPILTEEDVSEPPLPPASPISTTASPNSSSSAGPVPSNAQPKIAACYFLSTLAMFLTALVVF